MVSSSDRSLVLNLLLLRTDLVELVGAEFLNLIFLLLYCYILLLYHVVEVLNLLLLALDLRALLLVALTKAFKLLGVLFELHLHKFFAEGSLEQVGIKVDFRNQTGVVGVRVLQDVHCVLLECLHKDLKDFKLRLIIRRAR